MSDVTIVSVGFESAAVLPGMLDSIPTGNPIVLVDNNSTDETAQIAQEHGATTLRLTANTGFGVACNIGAARVTTPFVLFLNPDARLMPGALDALLASAKQHPQASAFNPALFGNNGRPKNRRGSTIAPQLGRRATQSVAEDTVTPILSGSALFCRLEAFNKVGGFDEAIFMYHEDDDLSLRLARDIGPLMLCANAKVVHLGSASSPPSNDIVFQKAKYRAISRLYAERKHGRRAVILRLIGRTTATVFSPYNLVSRRHIAKTSGTVVGTMAALRGHEPAPHHPGAVVREPES